MADSLTYVSPTPRAVTSRKSSRRGRRSVTETEPPFALPRVLLAEDGVEYRVLACEQIAGGDEQLVLVVERSAGCLKQWGQKYGLTPREARIAQLLAHRATNGEIAEKLHISRHTARHHTERVLAKLGLSSRAKVRERLMCALDEKTLRGVR